MLADVQIKAIQLCCTASSQGRFRLPIQPVDVAL
jgi:hypothetical protein